MTDKNNKKTRIKYTEATRIKARDMWLSGIDGAIIVTECGLNNIRILYVWVEKYGWKKLQAPQHFVLSTSIRYNKLMALDRTLTSQEIAEATALGDLLLKHEKLKITADSDKGFIGRPVGSKSRSQSKKNTKKKNQVDHLTPEDFKKFRDEQLYAHQKEWYEAGLDPLTYRISFILRSRKIGATWFFAYEAFENAVLTGKNSIFISATRQQAEVFKTYIDAIASQYFGVEISGNPATLSNGAQFIYVSTSLSAAQTYEGHVYYDESFWTRNFLKLYDVSSPIASFSECKKTIITTPSALSHPLYDKWSGAEYNEDRAEKDLVKISLSHAKLKHGALGDDGIWRQMVTLEDAVEKGFDRISVEQIKKENTPIKYRNYYMCGFIDDTDSVFKISELLDCMRDPLVIKHYDKDLDKPYGNLAVTVGYDPSGEGDTASATMYTLPMSISQKFQLIKMAALPPRAVAQAGVLKEWNKSFNIQHMELDGTGPGLFVPEFVMPFYPAVKVAHYSAKYKTLMVQKAQDVIWGKRFEYDASDKGVALAFMTIRQTTTRQGQITYESVRTKDSSHGDAAWASMHAFMAEDANPNITSNMTTSSYEH